MKATGGGNKPYQMFLKALKVTTAMKRRHSTENQQTDKDNPCPQMEFIDDEFIATKTLDNSEPISVLPSHFHTPPIGVQTFIQDCYLTTLIFISKDVTTTSQRIKETVSTSKIHFCAENAEIINFSEALVNVVPLHSKSTMQFLEEIGNSLEKVIVVTPEPRNEIEEYLMQERKFYHDFEILEDNLCWLDLTPDFQNKILDREVLFQQHELPLRNLIASLIPNYDNNNNTDLLVIMCNLEYPTLLTLIKQNTSTPTIFASRIPSKPVCYIDRRLRNVNDISEFEEQDFFHNCGRFLFITGASGMGKSSLLLSLAENLRSTFPTRFVLLIDIREVGKSFNFMKASDEGKVYHRERLISSICDYCCSSAFTKFLLQKCLTNDMSKEVLVELLIDGVEDDVDSEILLVLESLPSSIRIFVAAENHTCTGVEANSLYEIIPLKTLEQINLLTQIWSQKHNICTTSSEESFKKLYSYAEQCVQGINQNLKICDSRLVAEVPLQICLFAQVYAEEARKFIESDSSTTTAELPSFNVTFMYSQLLNKFDCLNESFQQSPFRNNIQNRLFKTALQSTFPTWAAGFKDNFGSIDDVSRDMMILESGIVEEPLATHNQKRTGSSPFKFSHNSLAKFVIANYILESFKVCNINEHYPIVKLFLNEVLAVEKSKKLKHLTICHFLNDLLTNTVTEDLIQSVPLKEEIMRYSKSTKIAEIIFALVRSNYLKIVRLLFETLNEEKLNAILTEQDFSFKLFSTAVQFTSLPMIQYLNNRILKWKKDEHFLRNICVTAHPDNAGFASPLHLATSRGKFSICQYLINSAHCGPEFWNVLQENHPIKNSILHECLEQSIQDEKEIIGEKKLILYHLTNLNEEIINKKNQFGVPPLMMNGISFELIKTLVIFGADVTARCPLHRNGTVLHYISSQKGMNPDTYHDLVGLVVAHGGNVNENDDNGMSPLLLALQCIELNTTTVDIFKRKMLDFHQIIKLAFEAAIELQDVSLALKIIHKVNDSTLIRDQDGNTATHLVLADKCLDEGDRVFLLQHLLEHGADINVVNYEGLTPTQFALQVRIQTLKLFPVLEDFGAVIYVEDLLQVLFSIEDFHKNFTKLEAWLEYVVEKMGSQAFERRAKNGKNLLHYACIHGSPKALEYLVEGCSLGSQVNEPDKEGNTPLHYAAAVENETVRKQLVHYILNRCNGNLSVTNLKGQIPLENCISHGLANLSSVKLLIPGKAEGNVVGKRVIKTIFQSSSIYPQGKWDGLMEMVKYILQEGHYDFDEFYNINSAELLHTATSSSFLNGVENLVRNCSCRNFQNLKDVFGNSLLHNALAGTGTLHLKHEIVNYLITQGADVSLSNRHNQSALVFALEMGYPMACATILKLFSKNPSKIFTQNEYLITKLLLSTVAKTSSPVIGEMVELIKNEELCFIEMLQEIVKVIPEPLSNYLDEFGGTILHHAVRNLHLTRAQYLIEKFNLEVNAVDNCGNSVLHIAFHLRPDEQQNFVKLLVKFGANIHATNEKYLNPLQTAFLEGKGVLLETLQFIVENGYCKIQNCVQCQANVKNDSRTLLHGAVQASHKDTLSVVKYLVDVLGLDVNERDINGNMPLHYTVQSLQGYGPQIVEYLISIGGRVDAANIHGSTPLLHSLEYLLETLHKETGIKQIMNISKSEEYDLIKIIDNLIENGTDVRRTYHHYGGTVLKMAVKIGLPRLVRYLVLARHLHDDIQMKLAAKDCLFKENQYDILQFLNNL